MHFQPGWSIFFFHVICTIVPKYRLKLFFNAMGVHQVEPGMTSWDHLNKSSLGKLCKNDVFNDFGNKNKCFSFEKSYERLVFATWQQTE